MIVSVGAGDLIARALPELGALLERPLFTLERVRVCKRDGRRLGDPHQLPADDSDVLGIWHKLMNYAGEEAEHHGHALYLQLIRRLREAGAAGATSLRGISGYHDDHPPHGDRLLALRPRLPRYRPRPARRRPAPLRSVRRVQACFARGCGSGSWPGCTIAASASTVPCRSSRSSTQGWTLSDRSPGCRVARR